MRKGFPYRAQCFVPYKTGMEHSALDSTSVFDYLRPLQHDDLCSVESSRVATDAVRSGSVVCGQLLGATPGTEVMTDSKLTGAQKIATAQAMGLSGSRLLQRVLGKRPRSPSAERVQSDDCIVTAAHLAPGCAAVSPSASVSPSAARSPSAATRAASQAASLDLQTLCDFKLPLMPLEFQESIAAKGRKRSRAQRVAKRRVLHEEDDVSYRRDARQAEPVSLQSASQWIHPHLADVLFNVGQRVDIASAAFGTQALMEPVDAWYHSVRNSGGNLLVGFPALREILRSAGWQSLEQHVASLSWPCESETWKPISVHAAALSLRASGKSIPGNASALDETLCAFQFRAQPNDAGIDSLHVKISLRRTNVAALFRDCLSADSTASTGLRHVEQRLEWRAIKVLKTRRRQQLPGSAFRMLGNSEDPLASQPPNFLRWPLRREQLRSLRWMQRREEEPDVLDLVICQTAIDLPGGDAPWRLELRCRELYTVRGGILGDAIGYGKTATTIGLIDSRQRSKDPSIPLTMEPYFFKSAATLILVPSNLLTQWEAEIKKFVEKETKMALRVFPIRTAAQLKALTVEQLGEAADVVICSYRLLFSPVYRRRLLELAGDLAAMAKSDSVVCRAPVDIHSLRVNTRRFQETPAVMGWKHRVDMSSMGADATEQGGIVDRVGALRFPLLEQFWWRRVVFDEFHELEAMGNTAQFESLRNLHGHYRWGLTGTPPARDVTQISTLASLFQVRLWHDLLSSTQVPHPFELDMQHNAAQQFLDHLARQNTSVEIAPVELREHIIEVTQTAEERLIYLQALRDNQGRRLTEDPENVLSDFAGTDTLLRLCSHFTYGSGTSADASSECKHILTKKGKQVERALARLHCAAATVELLRRNIRFNSLQGEPGDVNDPRDWYERFLQSLRDRFGIVDDHTRYSSDQASTAPAASEGASEGDPQQRPMQTHAESGDARADSKPEALAVDYEDVPPLPEIAPTPATPPGTCLLEAAASTTGMMRTALEALVRARRASDLELRAKEPIADGGDDGAVAQFLRCLRELSPMPEPLQLEAVKEGQSRFFIALKAQDAALRSHEFFKRTLSATIGEASAEQRSCSVCLDEDIPREELSITFCAHVFHTNCIREVIATMHNCPVCRQRLDASKDLMPLAQEPVREEKTKDCKAEGTDEAALARRFGSKLPAIVRKVRQIESNGEKVIIFCQWEDLKRKVATALTEFGVAHWELAGNVYKRGEVIRRFQEERGVDVTKVLLLSLDHCASGTNLTAANHVIFVHPMCTDSAERAVAYEAQAIGRCRRFGQEKPEVHCWRFVVRGTIEEEITTQHQRDLWEHHQRDCDQAAAAGGC